MNQTNNIDTRFEWFGTVPKHWPIARNKNAFRVVSKKVGEHSSDYDLLSLTLRGVILRDVDSGKGKFPESFDTYQEVRPDDIVFCLFDVDETPRTVGLSHHHGMVTGAYTVVRCTPLADPRFVTYFYLSIDQRKGLRPFYTGLRKVVRSDTFLNAEFPLPELEVQRVIADFLDRETARIDQLIEKKQRFLASASSRIETLVDRAISDPNISRIRFAHATEIIQRPARLSENDALVRLGLYNRGRGIFKKPAADEEGMGDSDFFYIKSGDLILSGQFAWEGAVAIATEHEEGCVVSHRYPVFRGRRGIKTAYLLGLLRSKFGDFILNEASRGSAGRNRPLNTWRLGKEKIPIPSADLQDAVESALIFEGRLKEKTEQSIAISNERRAALITAAVTGRIDVATWSKRGNTDRLLDQIETEFGRSNPEAAE